METAQYNLNLEHLPAGFTTAVAPGPNYQWILTKGLITPDGDGHFFYSVMNSFSGMFLKPYLSDGRHFISHIDNTIAIISPDLKADVRINFPVLLRARPKRSVAAGEPVLIDDLADVTDMKLQGVEIPDNFGVMFFFHVNWRQACFLDLEPLSPGNSPRQIPFEKHLGTIWARLSYPDIFNLTSDDFVKLADIGWFPFISVPQSVFTNLVIHIKNQFDPKQIVMEILKCIDDKILERMKHRVEKNEFLKSEVDFFLGALDSYKEGKYIPSVSQIGPRVEGVMRKLFVGRTETPNQKTMPEVLFDYVSKKHPYSNLMFPAEFRDFLARFYFRDFKVQSDGKVSYVSRHTQGHGVSDSASYTQEMALIYLLIFDQIAWYTSDCVG
jgi:hypothetical protein